jgi:hypothetical protein
MDFSIFKHFKSTGECIKCRLARHWCLVAKRFEVKKLKNIVPITAAAQTAQHFTIDERR